MNRLDDQDALTRMDMLGLTSRWVAAVRERESQRPDRLFDDPWAGVLAGADGRALMHWMEAQIPQPVPGDSPVLTERTRYFDDWMRVAAASGVRQFVILAAGMDTRAYRLDWPAGTRVYELDQPEVLDCKAELLRQAGAQPRAERQALAVDLRAGFADALRGAGYQPEQPSAWLIEGLLIYLPDAASVQALLAQVATLSAAGSHLALDIAGSGLAGLAALQSIQDRLRAGGAEWRFGCDDPDALLAQAGYTVEASAQAGQIGYRPGGQVLPARVSYRLLRARRRG